MNMRLLITPVCIAVVVLLSGIMQTSHASVSPQIAIADLLTSDVNTQSTVDYLSGFNIDSVAKWIGSSTGYPKPTKLGGIVQLSHAVNDSYSVVTKVYIPSHYNPSARTPLFVYLHGGVSRPEAPEIPDSELVTDPILKLCEQNGWILAFPLVRFDCVWWNAAGMDHIQWLIREMKRGYNIDDDRVAIGGFSDGGSGSYHLAMTRPTDFAVFFPWSGHMAVGGLDGGWQLYVANMQNRPVYATNGGVDQLYPTDKMLPMIRTAINAGANLTLTAYDTAKHDDSYLKYEMENIANRVNHTYRQPFAPTLYWEASDLRVGSVDWLSITEFDTLLPKAEWQKEYNCQLRDDRVTIGFMPDTKSEGGIKVASVMEDTGSAATKAGLKKDDLIVKLDDFPIGNYQDLSKARASKKRGDKFTLTVMRDGKELILKTGFPPVTEYAAFPYTHPSGAVRAVRMGNRFELSTSRIKKLSLYLHPEMINFDQPVVIVANGKTIYEGKVQQDIKFMVKQVAQNRDRRLIWRAKIDLDLSK